MLLGVRVGPPVGCRGLPGWEELSDKACGSFGPVLHRRRDLRHCVIGAENCAGSTFGTTCAEHYAHFEHIFDDTPSRRVANRNRLERGPRRERLRGSSLARLQTTCTVSPLQGDIRLGAQRQPDLARCDASVQRFVGSAPGELSQNEVADQR